MPHIFELFSQAERSMPRPEGGFGIGLTLVKWLVELHDGTIEAHSPGLGKGSEFIVRLPISAKRPEVNHHATTADRALTLTRKNVLVIDDNIDAAESLAALLRLQGHEVKVAYSGAAGLKLASETHPDMVILDIGMPAMDGYQVARQLRKQPEGNKAVLIALTGWGQEQDRNRSKEAGFDYHLTKPVDPQTLKEFFVGPILKSE
jgi:CheY-like chemotaxis protein